MADFKLGLIGENIARSKAPLLHRLAGALSGLQVTYDLRVPSELGLDFDAVFDRCAAEDYRGVNVTYPYKETAVARVTVDDPLVRAMGAVNTVLFEAGGARGFNTDHSGFIAAYQAAFGTAPPGPVSMLGAGGAGKAIAFALIALGLEEIHIADLDRGKAEALAAALRAARPGLRVSTGDSMERVAAQSCGLINCTPLGMVGFDGTVCAKTHMNNARWAFDAVYTPVDTPFLRDAEAMGLQVMSGYELFFHQGVEAFRLFCGRDIDPLSLRSALQREAA